MDQSTLFDNIQQLKQRPLAGGRKAPYKPLLLLYVLGKMWTERKPCRFTFEEVEPALTKLLNRHYENKRDQKPIDPFNRLKTDKIGWSVVGEDGNVVANPTKGKLIKRGATGGFDDETSRLLLDWPLLILYLAYYLLKRNFTESHFSVICDDVGLPNPLYEYILADCGSMGSGRKLLSKVPRRDPKFRERVLDAYRCHCALCGSAVRFHDTVIDLDVAHIRWSFCAGPDETANGIALCSSHRRMFEWGMFGIQPQDFLIKLNGAVNGLGPLGKLLWELSDTPILIPTKSTDRPRDEFLSWHLKYVVEGSSQ